MITKYLKTKHSANIEQRLQKMRTLKRAQNLSHCNRKERDRSTIGPSHRPNPLVILELQSGISQGPKILFYSLKFDTTKDKVISERYRAMNGSIAYCASSLCESLRSLVKPSWDIYKDIQRGLSGTTWLLLLAVPST